MKGEIELCELLEPGKTSSVSARLKPRPQSTGTSKNLDVELADDEAWPCLGIDGPLVLLEAGDDLQNLSYVGLNLNDLFHREIEFVELFDLFGTHIYKIAVRVSRNLLASWNDALPRLPGYSRCPPRLR